MDCDDCAWSLPDHFQGISSVPPTDLLHGWFLKKEGWVGGVAYLPSCTPKSTIVHGTCPRMKVCQEPIKPNGNSAMYFCRGCAHYATNHDFHDSQTLLKPWLLLRDSRCRTNVGKKQDTTMLPQPRQQQQHQHPPTNKQTQYQQIDMETNIHIIQRFICRPDSMRIVWSCFLRVQNHSIYMVITSHYHHIDLHETRWCQVGMFQRWRLRGGELGWVSLGGVVSAPVGACKVFRQFITVWVNYDGAILV